METFFQTIKSSVCDFFTALKLKDDSKGSFFTEQNLKRFVLMKWVFQGPFLIFSILHLLFRDSYWAFSSRSREVSLQTKVESHFFQRNLFSQSQRKPFEFINSLTWPIFFLKWKLWRNDNPYHLIVRSCVLFCDLRSKLTLLCDVLLE